MQKLRAKYDAQAVEDLMKAGVELLSYQLSGVGVKVQEVKYSRNLDKNPFRCNSF